MKEIYTLDMLPISNKAVIKSVNCDTSLKNRLFDLGIIENSIIIPLFRSPFGDPTAYLVKNAVIAIRNSDCKKIYIDPLLDD